MKKLLLSIVVLLGVFEMSSYAQQDTLYVVFTEMNSDLENQGVDHLLGKRHINPETFRYTVHKFCILSKGVFNFSFEYKNYNDEPDNPVIEKPVSFLSSNNPNIYDWDILKNTVTTKEQAQTYVNAFLGCDVCYFIDRADIKDGKCYLVPVTKANRRVYSATVLQ